MLYFMLCCGCLVLQQLIRFCLVVDLFLSACLLLIPGNNCRTFFRFKFDALDGKNVLGVSYREKRRIDNLR